MSFEDFSIFVRAHFPDVTDLQMRQFQSMEGLYEDWNARINVISRKDMGGLYDHHVLHSLAIAGYLRQLGRGYAADERHSVLDLGTGGGFPGIPLAIMYPGWEFVLCDSVGKKTIVAEAVAKSLGLDNVKVVNARAETLDATFDFVVSRAVTSLENFYPWVRDKYKDSIFYLKGGDVNEEISTLLRKFKLKPSSVHTMRLDSYIADDYFAEKFVIHIEKAYLCNPNSD